MTDIKLLHMNLLAQGLSNDGFMVGKDMNKITAAKPPNNTNNTNNANNANNANNTNNVNTANIANIAVNNANNANIAANNANNNNPTKFTEVKRAEANKILNEAEFINGKFGIGATHISNDIEHREAVIKELYAAGGDAGASPANIPPISVDDDSVDNPLIKITSTYGSQMFEIKRYPNDNKELLLVQKLIHPKIKQGFGKKISIYDEYWMDTYVKSKLIQKLPKGDEPNTNLMYNLKEKKNKEGKYIIENLPEKAENNNNSEEAGWDALQKLVGVDKEGPFQKPLTDIVGEATSDATKGFRKEKIMNMIKHECPDILVFVEDDFMETHTDNFIGDKNATNWEEEKKYGNWSSYNYGLNFKINGGEIITVNKPNNWFKVEKNPSEQDNGSSQQEKLASEQDNGSSQQDHLLYTCEIDEKAADVTYFMEDMNSGSTYQFIDTTNVNPEMSNGDNKADEFEKNRVKYQSELALKHEEEGNIYNSSIARKYKTNSNCVTQGNGMRHDGTTVYWNAIKYVCLKINLFNISNETKKGKHKSQGGVIVLLEERNTCNRFIVVGTHLSSGRTDEVARKKEWKFVKKAVNAFVKNYANIETSVIYSMDANSHINYGNITNGWSIRDGEKTTGGPADELTDAALKTKEVEKKEGKEEEEDKVLEGPLWKDIEKKYNTYWEDLKETSTKNKMYSVNKMRGLGSNQPLKVNEHELQLIDWIFGTNIDEIKLQGPKKTETNGYILGPKEIEDKLLNNYKQATNSVIDDVLPNELCPSDHLPICVNITIPNYKVNVGSNDGGSIDTKPFNDEVKKLHNEIKSVSEQIKKELKELNYVPSSTVERHKTKEINKYRKQCFDFIGKIIILKRKKIIMDTAGVTDLEEIESKLKDTLQYLPFISFNPWYYPDVGKSIKDYYNNIVKLFFPEDKEFKERKEGNGWNFPKDQDSSDFGDVLKEIKAKITGRWWEKWDDKSKSKRGRKGSNRFKLSSDNDDDDTAEGAPARGEDLAAEEVDKDVIMKLLRDSENPMCVFIKMVNSYFESMNIQLSSNHNKVLEVLNSYRRNNTTCKTTGDGLSSVKDPSDKLWKDVTWQIELVKLINTYIESELGIINIINDDGWGGEEKGEINEKITLYNMFKKEEESSLKLSTWNDGIKYIEYTGAKTPKTFLPYSPTSDTVNEREREREREGQTIVTKLNQNVENMKKQLETNLEVRKKGTTKAFETEAKRIEICQQKTEKRKNIQVCPKDKPLIQGFYKKGKGLYKVLNPINGTVMNINDLSEKEWKDVTINNNESGTDTSKLKLKLEVPTAGHFILHAQLHGKVDGMNMQQLGQVTNDNPINAKSGGGYISKKHGFKNGGSQKKHRYFK